MIRRHFSSSITFTVVSLLLSFFIGYYYTGGFAGALQTLFICALLGLLEISVSFDNAVVNATVLKNMSPLWQQRFLTWGMVIAVFGMRLIFPLAIVSVAAKVAPWTALQMAAFAPHEYAQIMLSVHHQVSAFGGAFLMLVAMKYFFDVKKDVHWLHVIEVPLVKMGKLEAIEVGLTIVMVILVSQLVSLESGLENSFAVLKAGLAGILTFLVVEGVEVFLNPPGASKVDVNRASLGLFLYLEILDASFSFDGVIGAFAITNNLFIIALGLGIGAMFVRSLTMMMVERGTLKAFRFLEHGAFYAVGALAVIMFLNTVIHVPELITGLVGAIFIGFSLWSSRR